MKCRDCTVWNCHARTPDLDKECVIGLPYQVFNGTARFEEVLKIAVSAAIKENKKHKDFSVDDFVKRWAPALVSTVNIVKIEQPNTESLIH